MGKMEQEEKVERERDREREREKERKREIYIERVMGKKKICMYIRKDSEGKRKKQTELE